MNAPLLFFHVDMDDSCDGYWSTLLLLTSTTCWTSMYLVMTPPNPVWPWSPSISIYYWYTCAEVVSHMRRAAGNAGIFRRGCVKLRILVTRDALSPSKLPCQSAFIQGISDQFVFMPRSHGLVPRSWLCPGSVRIADRPRIRRLQKISGARTAYQWHQQPRQGPAAG